MARLPIDLMTSGVREDLPSATYATEQATGATFGAQIGQQLQGFGDAGSNLVAKVEAYQTKQQKFDAELGRVKAEDADSQQAQENMRGLSGNADGYWQSQRDQTRKNMDAYLQTVPEGLRKEFAVQAESIVAARTKQAFTAQYQQADANTRLTLDEEARKAGLQVNQDPGAYDAALASAEKLIDASPLTDLDKTKRKAELRNTLAYTAEQAKAQSNPAAVVAAGVGGGLREKIAGKESGGNNVAQNPTSSARGKYQFLDTTWNGFAGAAGVPAVTADNKGGANDPRNNPALQEKVMDQYIAASTAELSANKLPVTDANLYLLHFMGQKGGTAFIRAMNNDASATAASAFPTQAAANTSVFYGGKDKTALSLSEVYAKLTKGLNGAGTTPSTVAPTSASRANLTADQTRAVDESARRSLVQQQAMQQAANDAALVAQRDQTYVALHEGPNPQTTYEAARKSGLISTYDQINKAEGIIKARDQGDTDLQTGLALMAAGRNGANPFDKSHQAGLDAVYDMQSKASGDTPGTAAAIFDRTGIVPAKFVSTLRGVVAHSDDPTQLGAGLSVASNILRQNPNALAGSPGKEQIEAAASEYDRLTGDLGMNKDDAVKRIMADARAPKDPIKSEVLQQFKKDYLSQEKLGSRMQSQLGSWFGYGARLPDGSQRSAVSSIYGSLAEEGMRQFQDPDKALAYADFQMKKQFGTQNGVITRYPPDKAGLPVLEGKGTGWVNEQAADVVKDHAGLVVDPAQISLVPVSRDGADTAQAFRNGGMDVKRDDSRPGQQSTFKSVPYQIVVTPTPDQIKAGASVQVVPGVYFPDVQSYVDKKNASATGAKTVMLDSNGVPYEGPAHAPELLNTPEQTARRKQADANADLLKRAQQEREQLAAGPAAAKRRQRTITGPGGFPLED